MRVLLTGVSSLPGYPTAKLLAEKGFNVHAIYNTHPVEPPHPSVHLHRLDLTEHDRVAMLWGEVKPDIVVHMAAWGDVDGCEEDKERALRINYYVTLHLTRLAAHHNTLIIYLSTDYVFDGMQGGYRERDPPNPINYYGLTKLLGETAVQAAQQHLIIRTSAIYGIGPGRMNFGRFLLEKLSKGEEVRALIDQRLSPTLNLHIAEAIVETLEEGLANDILHVAGPPLTRYEFATRLAEYFNFDTRLIKPACMAMFKWRAPRPQDSSLDTSYTRSMVKRTRFYDLEDALRKLGKEWRRYGH